MAARRTHYVRREGWGPFDLDRDRGLRQTQPGPLRLDPVHRARDDLQRRVESLGKVVRDSRIQSLIPQDLWQARGVQRVLP